MEKNIIHFLSAAEDPILEIHLENGGQSRTGRPFPELFTRLPFSQVGAGRQNEERLWAVQFPALPDGSMRRFRIDLGNGQYDPPAASRRLYETPLDKIWLQDGAIFDYPPDAVISPSRVIKIPSFTGSLPARALYVYLPRGYDSESARRYPVLYIHDGQNCFEAFAADSFVGTLRADETADRLIAGGRMQECLIIGVSNGGSERIREYLPPYARFRPPAKRPPKRSKARALSPARRSTAMPIPGRADRTYYYYRDEVAPFIARRFRVLEDRASTATLGTSLGGVFSAFIAWEFPEFARQHACVSPAFRMTANVDGSVEIIERFRKGRPNDIRLWLDSGTRTTQRRGDDDMKNTLAARAALLEGGFVEGPYFRHYLDQEAIHRESAWAARLPLVLEFLLGYQFRPTQ